MDNVADADLLELMAGPSDVVEDEVVTQQYAALNQGDLGQPSRAGASVKPKAKPRKGKKFPAPSDDTVTRQEFADVSEKISLMAEAIETMQGVMLTKPAKRARQDSEPSSDGESASKAANDLLGDISYQETPKGDEQLLNNFDQLYAEDAPTAEAVNDKLAQVIDKMVSHKLPEDKATEKLKSLQRPMNIKNLECTRVNPEVWGSLKPKTRSQDIKLQSVQQALLKGVVPIVSVIDSLMTRLSTSASGLGNQEFKGEITKLLDAVAVMGHANHELNMRRREFIKPDLNRQFAGLCSPHVPVTGFLFGDNLPQQCKDIQQTNKIGQQVGFSGSRGYHKLDRPGTLHRGNLTAGQRRGSFLNYHHRFHKPRGSRWNGKPRTSMDPTAK